MKRAKVVKEVKSEHGGLKIEVREYADGRYGFDWGSDTGGRKKVRLNNKSDAIAEAANYLSAGKAGRLDMLSVPRKEFEEFLRWRASRRPAVSVPALVESFLASKEKKGRSQYHLRGLRGALSLFAAAFPVPISSLTREEVERWMGERKHVGPRRWNNIRAMIISLHKFARREGVIGAEMTPVELMENKNHTPKIETYSCEEIRKLIKSVEDEWIPAIIFGAFSGMRPEELCPDPRESKPGLLWENIMWEKGKIDVPESVSKVRRRRFIPISIPVTAFLGHMREATGAILPHERISHNYPKWAAVSGVDWKVDGLRKSYAGYRLAILRNVHELSLEMGNSPSILHRHYLDLKHEDEAAVWFSTSPASLGE